MLQNVTLEISEDELKQLITAEVKKAWGREVQTISFDLQTAYSGYGHNETAYQKFKGVTVKLAPMSTSY